MEDLTEYSWEDFLSEEMYEEVLESYAEQLTNSVSGLGNSAVTEDRKSVV